MTEANESEIEWQVVHELLLEATDLLQPTFAVKNSRNSYLSIQMDPRMAGSIRRPYHGATQPHTPHCDKERRKMSRASRTNSSFRLACDITPEHTP